MKSIHNENCFFKLWFVFLSRLLTMVTECKIFPRIFAKSIVPLLLTPIVIAEQVALNQVIKVILKPKNKSNGLFCNFIKFFVNL